MALTLMVPKGIVNEMIIWMVLCDQVRLNAVTLANLRQARLGLVAALFLGVCSDCDCIVTQVGQCNMVCQHGIRNTVTLRATRWKTSTSNHCGLC